MLVACADSEGSDRLADRGDPMYPEGGDSGS